MRAGALAAVLELHIEQGPVLEETKVQIGVVSGIVSLKRWKCVATGFANHAGTTPMNRRKDALAAAAKHLLAVRDVVRAETWHAGRYCRLLEGRTWRSERHSRPC